jgi:hypothetical protein
MKNTIHLLFVLIVSFSAFSQTNSLNKHSLSLDFGSVRNRYVYPMNSLTYQSPVFTKYRIDFSVRLRSYGTWYLFSKSAYDLTPIAKIYLKDEKSTFNYFVGLGVDARIRLVNDERADVSSTAEPILALGMTGNFKKVSFSLPQWTRFYSNGISFSLLPEGSFHFSEKISAFARYELSYLSVYKNQTHEWRQDCFIGVKYNWD